MSAPRHQVFVSSTYKDLRDQRQAVLRQLLKMDFIPAGMELFAASDEEVWQVITKTIEQSDYYVVIVATRYGSKFPNGMSYTEKEYRYALEKDIPTLGFLYADPVNSPTDEAADHDEDRPRLAAFKQLVMQKTIDGWTNEDNLSAAVAAGLHKLMRDRPRPGWVKADTKVDELKDGEIAGLKRRIGDLQAALSQATADASVVLGQRREFGWEQRVFNPGLVRAFAFRQITDEWVGALRIPHNDQGRHDFIANGVIARLERGTQGAVITLERMDEELGRFLRHAESARERGHAYGRLRMWTHPPNSSRRNELTVLFDLHSDNSRVYLVASEAMPRRSALDLLERIAGRVAALPEVEVIA